MPRDTRRRFEQEIRKMRPHIRDAFLQAIADIRSAADLRALEEALARGDIEGALRAMRLDLEFFSPLERAIADAHLGGGDYALSSLPLRHPGTGARLIIRFQGRHRRVTEWIERESSRLITDLNEGQREIVRQALARGYAEGRNPRSTALDLVGRLNRRTGRRQGGFIGLSERDAGYVQTYRQRLASEGREAEQVERMAARYTSKKLRLRGEAIARTETLGAMNAGRFEAMQQLIDRGDVDVRQVTKEWDATGDMRMRADHAAADGQKVKFDEKFIVGGMPMKHPGDPAGGAKNVIRCRCYGKIKIDWLAGFRRSQ